MVIRKSDLLAVIEAGARREARSLAGEFIRAAEGEREAIQAALEFEQWLAESCGELLDAAVQGQ